MISSGAFFRLFIVLRTFVAKFLCRDLRTFSADFFVTEKQTPQTFSLLECMGKYRDMAIPDFNPPPIVTVVTNINGETRFLNNTFVGQNIS